jgi:hypothetical protein
VERNAVPAVGFSCTPDPGRLRGSALAALRPLREELARWTRFGPAGPDQIHESAARSQKSPPVERREALISDRKEIGRTVSPPTARCANASGARDRQCHGRAFRRSTPLGGRRKKNREDRRRPRLKQTTGSATHWLFENRIRNRSPDERNAKSGTSALPRRDRPGFRCAHSGYEFVRGCLEKARGVTMTRQRRSFPAASIAMDTLC